MEFQGIFPVLPTPFTAGGIVDEESLRRLVEFSVAQGAAGVVVFGLASEIYKLSDDERRHVLAVTVDQARGRVPVIAGTEHSGTEVAAWRSAQAQDLGASALMLYPPTFVKPDAAGVFDYYQSISAAVSVPMVIQDAPVWTGISLPASFLAEMGRRIEHVRAVKVEAPPTQAKMRSVAATAGADLALVGGYGGLYFPWELESGARATMIGLGNIDLFVQVYALHIAGDRSAALALFRKFLPLLVYQMASLDLFIAIQKWILHRGGLLDSPTVRRPGLTLDPVSERELSAVLAELTIAALPAGL